MGELDTPQQQRLKMQKELELKPCPFCGGKAEYNPFAAWEIYCTGDRCNVEMRTHWSATQIGAIEYWNTRAGTEEEED